MIVPYEKPKPTPRNYRPETVTGSHAKQVKNNEKHISVRPDSILGLLTKMYSSGDYNDVKTQGLIFA